MCKVKGTKRYQQQWYVYCPWVGKEKGKQWCFTLLVRAGAKGLVTEAVVVNRGGCCHHHTDGEERSWGEYLNLSVSSPILQSPVVTPIVQTQTESRG